MDATSTVLYLGILITTALIYDQLTKKIPSRLRAKEAPRSPFGLVRADKLNPHDKPARAHGIEQVHVIIFVHGLGSNPDTTWGPKDSNWVESLLPEDIPAALHKDLRIFFYNYDSYWKRDAVQARLWTLGKSLLDRIGSEMRATEAALILANNDRRTHAHIVDHTKSVFFLGTPHRGSSFSTWGSIAARMLQPLGSNPALLQEVSYDSLSLLELHEEFERAVNENLRVVNFFEQRKTRLLKVWFFQWEEFCVREQSATYGRVENIGLPVDHYGLNKFGSRDNNYQMVLGKLIAIIKPIALHQSPGLYAVPVGTVGTYTERNGLSTAVYEKLRVRHSDGSVAHALAICGLGGAGKTQLALKYAQDHQAEYDPVLWIDGRNEESVRSSFERCASELQLSVARGATQNTKLVDTPVIQAVLRWLRNRQETDSKWLAIIDNADDFTWGLKNVLPKGSQGSVIITSQDNLSQKLVGDRCEHLCIGAMEPTEARKLLLRHLDIDLDPLPEEVLQECDEIAGRLGHLALALDLAGAYIGNDVDQRQALRRYLTDFHKHQDHLLQSEQFLGLSASDKTVWTVWDTTLERIESRTKDCHPGMLLAFLAHFHGGLVQDEVFRLASSEVIAMNQELDNEAAELPAWLTNILAFDGKGWDNFHYRQACDMLARYSLIQRTQGDWPGVSMHGLVQWRAKKYAQQMPWHRWHLLVVLAACTTLLEDEANPQFRRHMVMHIPDVREAHLHGLGLNNEGMCSVWKTVGHVYFEEGWWKDVEKLDVQLMETSKTKFGHDHPDTLDHTHNLATTYKDQGRWEEAEALYIQVVETSKTKLGNDHPNTIISMQQLAYTYWHQNRLDEAEALEVQVLETNKKTLGENHLDTLRAMLNLASTYWNQGQWDKAETLELQVLENRKRQLGDDHPDTVNCMNSLALTYRKQGRLDEAEALNVQVMEVRRIKLGYDHPDTLLSMNNLACAWKYQGRDGEAKALMQECLQLRRRRLGIDHPDTIDSSKWLARWEAEREEIISSGADNSTAEISDVEDDMANFSDEDDTIASCPDEPDNIQPPLPTQRSTF
ncbi:hypothetical protein N0V90_011276 [Kalmusia sp. IMI 367209]|nr:hypothetical protein N0V90_011276 [Kalmusia sp. IMI 367209]